MENHPNFVQQLAQASWLAASKTCRRQHVEAALENLLVQHTILFKREVDQLTNLQVNYLKALCDEVEQISSSAILKEYNLGT